MPKSCCNIKRIIEEFSEEIEAPTQYRDKAGKVTDFYSPEQIEIIREYSNTDIESAPSGYLSMKQIAKELGVNSYTVKKIIEEFSDKIEAPTQYKNERGQVLDFYSPEQIETIREHSNTDIESAPSGYLNMNQIAKELGAGWSTVKRIIEEFSEEIEAPTQYKNEKGRVTDFYSPEQIKVIQNILISSYFSKKSPDT